VLGGEQVSELGYTFVLFPVMLNGLLLFAAVLLLNNMVPGRRYPSRNLRQREEGNSDFWTTLSHGISSQDLRSAIKSLNEFVDITEEQLDKLYQATIIQMRKRQLGDIHCEHVMSKDVVCVKESTPLSQVWEILQRHHFKAVPVLDHKNRVCGIITQSDLANLFMTKMRPESSGNTHIKKTSNDTAEILVDYFNVTPVGVVMSAPATTIDSRRHIVEAIPIFVERKIHHIPVVDANRVIAGILTRTDLLTLLENSNNRIG